jgi:hypothetical protein
MFIVITLKPEKLFCANRFLGMIFEEIFRDWCLLHNMCPEIGFLSGLRN